MYAIVKIQGQQFKVSKDQKLFVHRLNEKEGAKIELKDVLLIDDKGKIKVGTPNVTGASIKAKVLQHVKGDKVLVFKKKRRKGYQKTNGHRQQFSQILIEDIKKSATKKTAEKKEEVKEEVKKETKKPAAKKTATKKVAEKKPATKKAETKKPATKKPATKKAAAKKTDTKKKDTE